ncbi:hypothetical protein [Halegenticoccus soli]|uniref:hypothetical protein n=1 Tax=Halegenticoccus soli TaxID=1985678 RepID=UPI000C6D84E9|nr:hypothetical protein [Halegenticoccus soli]
MASAALGVTVLYALIAYSLEVSGSPIGSDWRFLRTMALYALPLIVPVAFISAVLVWRLLPANVSYYGAIGGVAATVGTYIGSLAVVFALAIVTILVTGETVQVLEVLATMGAIGFVAFAATFWLTLPVGCIAGIVHEHVHARA